MKIDCTQRFKNLEFCINYWKSLGFIKIYVVEQDTESRIPSSFVQEHPNAIFKFCPTSHSDAFHKTFLNNKALKDITSPYAVLADVDFIIPEKQIRQSCETLLSKEVQFLTPFNTAVYEVEPVQIAPHLLSLDEIETAEFIKWPSYSTKTMNQWMPFFNDLPFVKDEFFECSMGGVFFLNCSDYKRAGYDNETIIGWAFDDHERIDRIKKLGYSYRRIAGPAFHLKHPRNGPLALFNKNNAFEWLKIKYMDKKELTDYVGTWPWVSEAVRGAWLDSR